MSDVRRCVVCEEILTHNRANQTTCGADYCKRENRRSVAAAAARRRYNETRYPPGYYLPDRRAQREAREAMQHAISRGLPMALAAEDAAVATGNTVAQVLSMWRAAA
jgi:hypothetical protein